MMSSNKESLYKHSFTHIRLIEKVVRMQLNTRIQHATTATYLKVCKSCIWWYRKAIRISLCSMLYREKDWCF